MRYIINLVIATIIFPVLMFSQNEGNTVLSLEKLMQEKINNRNNPKFSSLINKKNIEDFVKQEYPILGVCNGFQVLTELGLLPGIDKIISDIPEACLNINDSNKFECRPTFLKHENNGKCIFTKKIKKNEIRLIPSAHAEGKLLFPLEKQDEIIKILEKNDQIVFRYVDPEGDYAAYPWNPNGSISNIAGICNSIGNVFGMMPHPERTFYKYQHPDWTIKGLQNINGDGRVVFESVLEYISKKF